MKKLIPITITLILFGAGCGTEQVAQETAAPQPATPVAQQETTPEPIPTPPPPVAAQPVQPAPTPTPEPTPPPPEQPFVLSSNVFSSGTEIPFKYSCDGEDINPQLSISGTPAGTKSLALILDDPDAPGGTWIHWTLWNISPDTKTIAQNSVPAGAVQGITSFDTTGYGGPCPPSGTHRYVFKLYALDVAQINLSASARASVLESAMAGRIIKKTELMGRYTFQ